MVVRTASLAVHGGPKQGMSLLLGAKSAGLGRASDNDVIIRSPSVSRHHARITETQFGFVLIDLDSTNGTYVNGRKIPPVGYLLSSGDKIRFGFTQAPMIFRQDSTITVVMETDSMVYASAA